MRKRNVWQIRTSLPLWQEPWCRCYHGNTKARGVPTIDLHILNETYTLTCSIVHMVILLLFTSFYYFCVLYLYCIYIIYLCIIFWCFGKIVLETSMPINPLNCIEIDCRLSLLATLDLRPVCSWSLCHVTPTCPAHTSATACEKVGWNLGEVSSLQELYTPHYTHTSLGLWRVYKPEEEQSIRLLIGHLFNRWACRQPSCTTTKEERRLPWKRVRRAPRPPPAPELPLDFSALTLKSKLA